MPFKKNSGEHPTLADLNKIYGPKQIQTLAQAHSALSGQFRLGDLVKQVPGIGAEDVRQWQVHMRSMPQLSRALLEATIQYSLTSNPPRPIKWVVNRRSASGWMVSVTERRTGLVVKVTPPALKAKSGAK